MTDALKNIFDADSIAAIQNAAEIAPTQEKPKPVGNVVVGYEEKEVQYAEPSNEVVYNDERVIELEEKLKHQNGVLNRVIKSQNEMIKELNQMQEKMQEIASKPVVQAAEPSAPAQQELPAPKKEEKKQQNGACDGLNPDDFSVEKTFYFGNK